MSSTATGDDRGTLASLGPLFAIDGPLHDAVTLGRGHIHETWLATYRADSGTASRYVHQRVNTAVFTDPSALMANMARVTDHLAAKAAADPRGEPHRRALRLLPSADGSLSAVDAEGSTWRTFDFIDGAAAQSRLSSPQQAVEAAGAVARFEHDLADLPGPPLAEVISGFHDVGQRLTALQRAVAEDVVGRARSCQPEVAAVLDGRGLAWEVGRARASGLLPERIVHNDAKVGNVLFDEETGCALCLIDLDTVGSGTVLFDVGDLIRSGAAITDEDGPTETTDVRADIVDAVLDGYVSAGTGFLTGPELELLPLGGPLMALEASARFLTDHLRGDVYFRVDEPGHNLARARNQVGVLKVLAALARWRL